MNERHFYYYHIQDKNFLDSVTPARHHRHRKATYLNETPTKLPVIREGNSVGDCSAVLAISTKIFNIFFSKIVQGDTDFYNYLNV